MEKLFQDLRFALRVYAKTRSFTIVTVLALAIGIGSNIAVLTVINALLFRSLPYPDGDRLVQVGRSLNEGPVYLMSYADSANATAVSRLARAGDYQIGPFFRRSHIS